MLMNWIHDNLGMARSAPSCTAIADSRAIMKSGSMTYSLESSGALVGVSSALRGASALSAGDIRVVRGVPVGHCEELCL